MNGLGYHESGYHEYVINPYNTKQRKRNKKFRQVFSEQFPIPNNYGLLRYIF